MPFYKFQSDPEVQNVDCKKKDIPQVPPPTSVPVKKQEPPAKDGGSCDDRHSAGRSPYERFLNTLDSMVDGPVTWFRTNIIEKNKTPYPWYHEKFQRVPTIDTCYTDDVICYFEANMQYKRDLRVDNEILSILRKRFEECVLYESPDHLTKCKLVHEQYQNSLGNWFTKYGDLGAYGDVRSAYMKQKHRLIWERRYGPVGGGMDRKKGTKSQVTKEGKVAGEEDKSGACVKRDKFRLKRKECPTN